eukprot:TRINITY_DN10800_c0_g1_i1.p1 TRINITY_DN10800_c0_g1~~TRINITY_DN10800_c0_g1_i1.p1  ORF type:complete len:449 (+),score=53.46 TRINITY_DN10800_c0_g1_i1:367-1713(+)
MGGSHSSQQGTYIPPPRPTPTYQPQIPQPPLTVPSYYQPASYSYPEPASTPPAPSGGPHLGRKFSRKYSHIADKYTSLDQVQSELGVAGLESSNLIVGIDFTKSNEWTGKKAFNGRSLHSILPPPMMNPYEQALSIIGRTLSPFDEDNLIPCFGFGDASTHDQNVFSFFQDHRPCNGFEEALQRYRAIVPNLRLAGPTSFAPLIESAIEIVEESGGQYHVLVIIADGQVTRSVDTEPGQVSPQEEATINAIVAASEHPLSIILVGVGDGPWDTMREFDDNIPSRGFDNFQFVNFTQIMAKNMPAAQKEALFALSALMEIPSQYKASIELKMLGRRKGGVKRNPPLPPPPRVLQADAIVVSSYPHSAPSVSSTSGYPPVFPNDFSYAYDAREAGSSAAVATADQVCPICYTNPKDMAFQCGHQTCRDCGTNLTLCPICRDQIVTRIRLY